MKCEKSKYFILNVLICILKQLKASLYQLSSIQFGYVKSNSCKKYLYRQNVLCTVQYHLCTQLYDHSSYRVSENMLNNLNVVIGAHLCRYVI
jgi:hypothetical protein